MGRLLTNTPGGGAAVADHALALMLVVGKRVAESHARLQAGDWRAIVGTELYGKTVGLVGLGRIGSMVARRLKGFDAHVIVADPYLDEAAAQAAGVTRCSLESLLQQSDFISLHAPLTPDTRHLINARTLALMKRDAILVNTSRGELVDESALLQALTTGVLGGAGLDVFAGEKDPRPVRLRSNSSRCRTWSVRRTRRRRRGKAWPARTSLQQTASPPRWRVCRCLPIASWLTVDRPGRPEAPRDDLQSLRTARSAAT